MGERLLQNACTDTQTQTHTHTHTHHKKTGKQNILLREGNGRKIITKCMQQTHDVWKRHSSVRRIPSLTKSTILTVSVIVCVIAFLCVSNKTHTHSKYMYVSVREYECVCVCVCVCIYEGRKEMFYLTTHSTHYIYGYMVSDIW